MLPLHHETESVLIISYDWPPMVSGVRRWVKFARYLPDFGYQPFVVCARPTDYGPHDSEPLVNDVAAVPARMARAYDVYHLAQWFRDLRRGHKTDYTAPAADAGPPPPADTLGAIVMQGCKRAVHSALNFCMLPDDRRGWVRSAVKVSEKMIAKYRIKKIVTTSYPHSAHLVGLALKTRRPDLFWLADFRDGWVQNPYFAYAPTPFHRRWQERKEAEVVRCADAVTTVCQPIASHLVEAAAFSKPVHVISNGYDRADMPAKPVQPFDKLTLAYTGTLFMHRTPDMFFTCLHDILRDVPNPDTKMQVIFMCEAKPEHYAIVERYGLDNIVRFVPMGSHRAALELQARADGLLLFENTAPNSEIMLTQKIFEYIASGRPILAIAPEGAMANVLRAAGCGVVVPPDDRRSIRDALHSLLALDGSFPYEPKRAYIEQFDRVNLTRRLARVLDLNG